MSKFLHRTVCATKKPICRTYLKKQESIAKGARCEDWKPVIIEEMNSFIGLTLLMGIAKKPTVVYYWSTSNILSSIIFHSVMHLFFIPRGSQFRVQ